MKRALWYLVAVILVCGILEWGCSNGVAPAPQSEGFHYPQYQCGDLTLWVVGGNGEAVHTKVQKSGMDGWIDFSTTPVILRQILNGGWKQLGTTPENPSLVGTPSQPWSVGIIWISGRPRVIVYRTIP